MKIGLSLDGGMSPADWRHDVNPRGKYMPGKPAWYMYDSCQSKRSDSIGVLCSAVFWSQNNGLQLQNLTIENTLGDSVDAGNHPAVALVLMVTRYRLTTLTFSVVRTPSLSPTAVCRTVWKRIVSRVRW